MRIHGTGVFLNLNTSKLLVLFEFILDRGGVLNMFKCKYLIFNDLRQNVYICVLIYTCPIGPNNWQIKSNERAFQSFSKHQESTGLIVPCFPLELQKIDGIIDVLRLENGCISKAISMRFKQ